MKIHAQINCISMLVVHKNFLKRIAISNYSQQPVTIEIGQFICPNWKLHDIDDIR